METTAADEPTGDPLVATYSCNMLATAPMAHDACPYFRITGDKGELVIHGNGLFREEPGAGGLRMYNKENPKGMELFSQDRVGGFFLGFAQLWQDILRIVTNNDEGAAHESVVRAADDVRVVLAIYKSAETGQWETV
jgi:predicted dehydrogenase